MQRLPWPTELHSCDMSRYGCFLPSRPWKAASQPPSLRTSIDADCRDCSWPWQWFALGKGGRPLFVTSNQCILVKNTFGWSTVVSCACEIIQLFFVLFCVVRAARKFRFRLVINEERNLSNALVETRVFDRIYPRVVVSVKGCTQAGRTNSFS
jgi:hypothetical protein